MHKQREWLVVCITRSLSSVHVKRVSVLCIEENLSVVRSVCVLLCIESVRTLCIVRAECAA